MDSLISRFLLFTVELNAKGVYIKYVGGGRGWRILQIFQKEKFVAEETIDLNISWPSNFFRKYFPSILVSYLRLTCSSASG